jgi:nitrate reductase NapE component
LSSGNRPGSDGEDLSLLQSHPLTEARPLTAHWSWDAGFLVIIYAAGVGFAVSAQIVDFYSFHLLLAMVLAIGIGGAIWLALSDRSLVIFVGFSILYCLFHFGKLPHYLLNPWTEPTFTWEWYHDEPLIRYAYLAAVVFLIGILSTAPLRRLLVFDRIEETPFRLQVSFDVVSYVLLGALVAAWFYIVKVVLSIGDYGAYLENAPGQYARALSIIYPLIAGILIFGCLWSKRIWPLLVIFTIWGIPALAIGLRYAVFIPLMLMILCLHAQGRLRIRWWVALSGGVATLAAISFVREYRYRTSGLIDAAMNSSPIAGMSEMGFSTYPMRAVMEWISAGIDYTRWGETYWAPFERTLAIVLPIGRVPAAEDFRLMNVAMASRNGNFGFSISAEAMLNFGWLGCFLIGSLVGVLLICGGKAIEAKRNAIVLTGLVFGIFYHVRQSFVGAYGSAVWIIVAGAALWALAYSIARLRSPPVAAAPR